MRRFQLGPEAGRLQTCVVALMAQLAEIELGGAIMRFGVALQGQAGLTRTVVEHQLTIGAAAVLT